MGLVNIFLIRHGESVDNVAGLLAGVRDASLTSHGVIQARRLGAGLAKTRLSWIFTSNLQRAVRTAEAVRDAQTSDDTLDVFQLPELREKDFGSDEGRRWGSGEAGAGDWETKDAMRERAARFVDGHLSPIVVSATDAAEMTNIAIVSHGMILSTLLHLLRSAECFPPSHIAPLSGDGLLRWSNTGYAHLELSPVEAAVALRPLETHGGSSEVPRWPHLRVKVVSANNVEHLAGLKKTRGGIGSAQFDSKQKTLASFFTPGGASKKRKAEELLEK